MYASWLFLSILSTVATGLTVNLSPRATFQHTVYLPLQSSQIPGEYNLLLVAEEGHDASRSSTGICSVLGNSFNMSHRNYANECPLVLASLVRSSRGLALQHDPRYFRAARALEEKLGTDGYTPREFEDNVLRKPFRAAALGRLLAEGAAGDNEVTTICETGFGAGHSALLFLTLAPQATVHSFELGLARVVIPAQDYLEETYPERTWMYLGESAMTVPRLPDYFPESPCDFVYLNGATSYDSITTDLSNFKRVVATPGHVVVLAGAAEGTAALRAWRDAVSNGIISWEATIYESPEQESGSDALVIGRFVGGEGSGVGDMMVQRRKTAPPASPPATAPFQNQANTVRADGSSTATAGGNSQQQQQQQQQRSAPQSKESAAELRAAHDRLFGGGI